MTNAPVDFSKYMKPPTPGLNGDICTQAPPKHGKTFFAASASRFFPDSCRPSAKATFEPTKSPKLCELKDVLHVALDAGAIDGFAELNISVPFFVDMRAMIADLGTVKGRDEGLKLIKALVKEHASIEYIIVDTVSTLDKAFLQEYIPSELEDTQRAYGRVFDAHKHFHSTLSFMRPKKHYLFHSKATVTIEGSKRALQQKTQRAAAAMPGQEQIVPEVTGQSRSLYLGNASIIFALLSKIPEPKYKEQFIPVVYPYGGKDFEGGNRFHQALEGEEPADLKYIIDKIQRASKR